MMKYSAYSILVLLWLVLPVAVAEQAPPAAVTDNVADWDAVLARHPKQVAAFRNLPPGVTVIRLESADQLESFLRNSIVFESDDLKWDFRVIYDKAARGDERYPQIVCSLTAEAFQPRTKYSMTLRGRALIRAGKIVSVQTYSSSVSGPGNNLSWYPQRHAAHHDGVATVKLYANGTIIAWFKGPHSDDTWYKAKSQLSGSCQGKAPS